MIIPLGKPYDPKAIKRVLAPRQTRQGRTYKRPPRPVVEQALVEAQGRVADAAARLGVHRASLYRWLADDPALVEALRALYAELAAAVESSNA
jgi:hypothetical protein